MGEENVEIVRRVFEAFQTGLERGDPGAAFDTKDIAPDAEWVALEVLGGEVFRGREGFIRFMGTWTEDFEDWGIRLERLVEADDDAVIALFHQWARGRSSGVPVELNMAVLYELEAGRVVRMRNYPDLEQALESAGAEG